MTAFGELLRQAREVKGVTLREAERATRISRTHLRALEDEEFVGLPPLPYARGIVRNYAQYLGLDPRVALDSFQQATGAVAESYDVVPNAKPLEIQSHWAPNFAIIAFMVVMSAIVFAWMYSAYFQRSEVAQPTTVGVATVTPVSPSLLAQVTVQATVATQGGGIATATQEAALIPSPAPTETATATPSPSADAGTAEQAVPAQEPTAAVAAPDVVESEEQATSDEPVEESLETTTGGDEDASTGAYTFVIWVTADVWVQAIVDGEVVLDEVLSSGSEVAFSGNAIAVATGDAGFVHFYVDGAEYSAAGNDFTFP